MANRVVSLSCRLGEEGGDTLDDLAESTRGDGGGDARGDAVGLPVITASVMCGASFSEAGGDGWT